jgi:hypothetical protein
LISTKLGQDIPEPKNFDSKPNFLIKDAQIWNILDVPELVPSQNAPTKKKGHYQPYLRNSLEQLKQWRLTIKQYWRGLKAFFSSSSSTRVTEANLNKKIEKEIIHSSSLPSTQNQLFAILEKQHRKL